MFSASPGSKPTKIRNVKLEKGKTFKLGTTTITLAEVTPGEDTAIELALPRSVLYTIRDVKFIGRGRQAARGRPHQPRLHERRRVDRLPHQGRRRRR